MSAHITASLLFKNQQYSKALPLLEALYSETPEDQKVLAALGETYFRLLNFDKACEIFLQLWNLDQMNLEALHFAARALYRLGYYKKALAYADYVLRRMEPDEQILMTRGLSSQKAGLLAQASADYEAILELNPINADALHNLATLKAGDKNFVESIQLFEKAFAVNPKNKAALANAIYYARTIAAWIVEKNHESEIPSLGVDGYAISPFSMLALDDNPLRHRQRSRCYWLAMTAEARRVVSSHRSGDKIRIGYFSADFYDHATMHLLADVLRLHDRDKFEIFGYSIRQPKVDQVSQTAAGLFDCLKDVSHLTDEMIAEAARKDCIDIAVDLKGFTSFARPAIFAYGAGKVQINYLGYPGTMGSAAIDYIIADDVIISEEDEKFYDEKVLRLPGCYQSNNALRASSIKLSRSDFGLPDDVPVLASFNAIYKVGLSEFLIWMRLLNKHSDAVLWIICETDDAYLNLLDLASQFDVSKERIIRADPVQHVIHQARIGLADVFVDTFNVCGHTTVSDALRAGLPVVTKYGNAFASRVAASLLSACGLHEWIAHSEDEYFKKIDQYLEKRNFAAVKQEFANAIKSSNVFNPKIYTENLERLFISSMAGVDSRRLD